MNYLENHPKSLPFLPQYRALFWNDKKNNEISNFGFLRLRFWTYACLFLVCYQIFTVHDNVTYGCLLTLTLFILLQTLGKIGRVQQIYHDNDLKVCFFNKFDISFNTSSIFVF